MNFQRKVASNRLWSLGNRLPMVDFEYFDTKESINELPRWCNRLSHEQMHFSWISALGKLCNGSWFLSEEFSWFMEVSTCI